MIWCLKLAVDCNAAVERELSLMQFHVLVRAFHQIMPDIEVIYNQTQSDEISVFKVNEYITNFKTAVLEITNSKYCENLSQTLVAEAEEVCDCICVDIVDRYSCPKHLLAAKLFNKESFNDFKNELPTEKIPVVLT